MKKKRVPWLFGKGEASLQLGKQNRRKKRESSNKGVLDHGGNSKLVFWERERRGKAS